MDRFLFEFMRFVLLVYWSIFKAMWWLGKLIYQSIKEVEEHKKIYGPEQPAMPVAAPTDTDDLRLRVAMRIDTKQIERPAFFGSNSENWNVLAATFDFSPKAIQELRRKNLQTYTLVYADPVSKMDANDAERYGKDGKVPVTLNDIISRPRQELHFRQYDDMMQAMEAIKDGLKKLKDYVAHGSREPVTDVFEA